MRYRTEKANPNRTRLTVGGDRVNYPGDCKTPTTDLLTVNLLLNSKISTPGAHFMTIDIKDFYLMTLLDQYKYMRLKMANLTKDVIQQYNLQDKVTKYGYVYLEIRQRMYELPQVGILTQKQLEKRLITKGYKQSRLTPGFWTHAMRPISFILCVDNFGVKYEGNKHVQYLMAVLEEHYMISHYWKGTRYLGIDLEWDYARQKVHLSMLLYMKEALIRFDHAMPRRLQDQPHPYVKPKYGQKVQYIEEKESSP